VRHPQPRPERRVRGVGLAVAVVATWLSGGTALPALGPTDAAPLSHVGLLGERQQQLGGGGGRTRGAAPHHRGVAVHAAGSEAAGTVARGAMACTQAELSAPTAASAAATRE
jgi:hypothetical protein